MAIGGYPVTMVAINEALGRQQPYQQESAQAEVLFAAYRDQAVERLWTNRKEEGMLERLKNLGYAESGAPTLGVTFEATVEGLVELAAYGRSLKAEFEAQEIPTPEWLTDNLRLLEGRIKVAYRRQREEKLRRVEKEIEELRSKEEKKQAKEKEAAELRRSLGLDAEADGA